MDLANDSRQEPYEKKAAVQAGVSRVVGLGLVSAVSAIAGGLAMAWWHRKTLAKLQNPIAADDQSAGKSQKVDPKVDYERDV